MKITYLTATLLSVVMALPSPQDGDIPNKPLAPDFTYLCDPTLGYPPSDPSDEGACPNPGNLRLPTFKCVTRGDCPNSDPDSSECRYYGACAWIRRDGTQRPRTCNVATPGTPPRDDILCIDAPTDECDGDGCPGIWAAEDGDVGSAKEKRMEKSFVVRSI